MRLQFQAFIPITDPIFLKSQKSGIAASIGARSSAERVVVSPITFAPADLAALAP